MSNQGKCLLTVLEEKNLLDFGTFIAANVVWDTLEIKYPETASKREYDQIALQEMSAVDYVRNVLLSRGMYIRGVAGGYRILTVSENFDQVEQYIAAADRKWRRGQKLLKNTPREAGKYPDQQEARIELKRESVRSHRSRHQIAV